MATVVIIGSGMMGSALAFPARENGNTVRLVGTHLDREIIETCKKHKRKVALFGRSMDTSIDIATKCGYIKDKNIISKVAPYGLKVLGNGNLEKNLTVKAAKFSETAIQKITKAGGKAEVL